MFYKPVLTGNLFVYGELILNFIQNTPQYHVPALFIYVGAGKAACFIEHLMGQAGKTQYLYIQNAGQIKILDQVSFSLEGELFRHH